LLSGSGKRPPRMFTCKEGRMSFGSVSQGLRVLV
jgi:hypothetical protein